jgi:ketosteroid isomerase-like protein
VDVDELKALLTESWALRAPRRLLAEFEASRSRPASSWGVGLQWDRAGWVSQSPAVLGKLAIRDVAFRQAVVYDRTRSSQFGVDSGGHPMAAEDEVRQASKRFYAALNGMVGGDASPMSAVWSHSADVTTMHPVGVREVGWEQVRPVWEQVASMATGGQIRLSDQLIRVGTDLAYEVGMEEGEATLAGERVPFTSQRVTNIYRREGGEWKIVHHHSDPSPAMNDLLKRLQPPPH